MNPATLAASIRSAEDVTAALVSRAASLAGKPLEHDAWILAAHAATKTNNLRTLATQLERRAA